MTASSKATQQQCFLFSQNIGYFTPKNIHFHHLERYLLDQSIQKNIFKFEKGRTAQQLFPNHWQLVESMKCPCRHSSSRKLHRCLQVLWYSTLTLLKLMKKLSHNRIFSQLHLCKATNMEIAL